MKYSTVMRGLIVMCLAWVMAGCVTVVQDPMTEKASRSKAVQDYVALGMGYFRNRQYDLAIKRFRRALEIDSDDPRARSGLGLVYQAQQEYELAENMFREVIRTHPEFTEGRNYYAAFLYQQGRFEEALAQLQEAVKDVEYEGRELLFFNIGQIERRLGRTDKAIEAYRKSLVLNPAQPQVRLALAFAYMDVGQGEQAWEQFSRFREAVRRGLASHTAASAALGVRIAEQTGRKDEAASLRLLLKNQFGASDEARRLLGEK